MLASHFLPSGHYLHPYDHRTDPHLVPLCFVHQSIARRSPEPVPVAEEVPELAADEPLLPRKRNSARSFPHTAAVDLHPLRRP